jgi:hypothetical protein
MTAATLVGVFIHACVRACVHVFRCAAGVARPTAPLSCVHMTHHFVSISIIIIGIMIISIISIAVVVF